MSEIITVGLDLAKRRNFSDQFKAKVALEALRGDKSIQEIAAKHQLHPNQVSTWKRQAVEGMADVFSGGKQSGPTEAEVKSFTPRSGSWQWPTIYMRKILSTGAQLPVAALLRCVFMSRFRADRLLREDHAGSPASTYIR